MAVQQDCPIRLSVISGFLRASEGFISEIALVESEESYSHHRASGNCVTQGIGVVSVLLLISAGHYRRSHTSPLRVDSF